LAAAVAPSTTTVHLKPDSGSHVILVVKAGEDLPASLDLGGTPAGWTAVSLPGPHDVFVHNKYISKELDVKPGAPLHLKANSDSPVLTHATAEDKVEITGLRGRWTQLSLDQAVTGYVFGTGSAATASSRAETSTPAITTAPVTDVSMDNQGSALTAAPATGPGHVVDRTAAERESLAALPRLFEGMLASTRSPLRPRRPYDFALESENGTRFAYLDLTKILLKVPVERYLNRNVVVYGVARPIPKTKDIVIQVESLQLR
jgi:uncharacterized protein YgiM (DUF1202 family)